MVVVVVKLLHGFSKTSNQSHRGGGKHISGVWTISDDDDDGIFFSFIINLLFGSSDDDGIFLLFHQPLGLLMIDGILFFFNESALWVLMIDGIF
jgi:hypothetical protein